MDASVNTSNNPYQDLLESTRAVPWELDLATWRFSYVGPRAVELLGYPVEHWHEPGFWAKHLHPDDAEWAPAFCQRSTEKGEDHDFEYRMIAADGRTVWIKDIVKVVLDEDGKPVRLQGFMFDVTERKQTELIMRSLAGAASTADVGDFLHTCVRDLADVYGARFAFVGLVLEGGESVRTQAVWGGGQIVDNFTYELEGTPCKDILDQTKELIPSNASTLYADDRMLVDMGIDSYFGAPVVDSEGRTIGLVSVMDVKPLEVNAWTAPILGVYASRIAVELERSEVTRRLQYSQNALAEAQRIAGIGSFEWDRSAGRVFWSDEALRLLGAEDCRQTRDLAPYLDRVPADEREAIRKALGNAGDKRRGVSLSHRLTSAGDGERYVDLRVESSYDRQRQRELLIGTLHDVTERHEQEAELSRMANFDTLTGLPNRCKLHVELDALVATSAEHSQSFCLALLDLDGFKEINDTLGHFAGDELLRQLKPRLDEVIRPTDLVARLGGDEFAVVLNPVASAEQAMALAEDLRAAIGRPFSLDEKTVVQVGVSIGLSLFPEHGDEPGVLLRRADIAMYQAKKLMTGQALYDAERDPYGPRRLALINDIRQAVESRQLEVHYQPKVDIDSGELRAVEALVRWHHPEHGYIPPDEFVPLCQMSDLIHRLTEYVIEQALRDGRRLRRHAPELVMAVNITARDLMNHTLPQCVSDLLTAADMPAAALQLEITENDLMHDPEGAKRTVDRLNGLGVGFAIDDFGTGYSSLSYLKHLKVEEIKIDRSFVRDMIGNDSDATIVRSTIDLGRSLGLWVTAEGVEDAATLKRLADYGCETVQGYHIAQPMPIDDLCAWVAPAAASERA